MIYNVNPSLTSLLTEIILLRYQRYGKLVMVNVYTQVIGTEYETVAILHRSHTL